MILQRNKMWVRMAHTSLAQLALCSVILALAQTGPSALTYQWKDSVTGELLICNKCQPGTSVAKHCTSTSPTQCQPCPDNHYTQYWNYLDKCRYCNVFCEDRERVKHECNATHNRVCECQPGYHRGIHFCVQHKACDPGYRVSQEGTAESNTECAPCPAGTFAVHPSMEKNCRPHTNCSSLGLEVNVPGTTHHDTLCTSCLGHYNLQEVNAECDQAVQDFVVHQKFGPRRIRRLQQSLNGQDKLLRDAESYRKLRNSLAQLRNSQPDKPFLPTLLPILRRAGLGHLEEELRIRFLQHHDSLM
ncbi:tumor necrosis factor receptor superfamily member 6B [Xenopus laevis]|uniref:TNFR-Cys domain-containing protein n=2 Tax=Xenopus laevis TaxID=8355 RepID=A0A974BXC2_XENLA|nr:tumor necrosis factor receptor superfamily member 6B [Xenopus laevis]OCT62546.1 hypothetical protein XELAEV_18043629mg [Xenopus laevis]